MNIFKKINNFFNKLNVIAFIILMTIITYILNILLASIFLKITNVSPSASYGTIEMSITGLIFPLIISPWTETILFQSFIFYIFSNIKKFNYPIVKLLISTLCFGLFHAIYNPYYAISAFAVGIIFAYSYLLYEKKNSSPIKVTALIHAGNNAIAIFLPIIITKL
ncbi:CAAX protease self-immunity family protein [Clostridium argentinense CDC 2741]|uniref:CAAX protease self-immunity family protein n=1 Tax=Clostridium argentinense CDC 2741 TaxID=1418104 RepID=A0A0C1QW39_9CLOT|nr:CPBP family intramembrane glutamic endopeptidase [Clostridium argentinense]ARC84061.1 CPBP family intramembrane metalloprotease [Clostridium argentinense]KIE45212.1 CAAX protease self-immunity family protein [Clostridium argentinense CDC 2741]